MANFGMLHDLRIVETQVRREIAIAANNVHIARQILNDIPDGDPKATLVSLLDEAYAALKKVSD